MLMFAHAIIDSTLHMLDLAIQSAHDIGRISGFVCTIEIIAMALQVQRTFLQALQI
jgi:hypothetical protein